MSGTPLSDESSGDPQNEQKLTPLSCPGAPGRLADKLRDIHFIIFFENDVPGERRIVIFRYSERDGLPSLSPVFILFLIRGTSDIWMYNVVKIGV